MDETVLTESKSMREEYISKDYILDKVKALSLLPDNANVTIEMVADYYEVDKELVKYHIKENKDELLSDGLKVLKGKELKEFKTYLTQGVSLPSSNIGERINSLTLIPRKAILRLGMLIQKSEIAKQVRTYLLNVEENTDVQTRLMSISESTNETIIELKNKFEFLKISNNTIMTENEELKHITYNLISKVDELLDQPLFKIYTNSSNTYEKLVIEFTEIMAERGNKSLYAKNYPLFNAEFSNWIDIDFKDKKLNKKDYWLKFYGIDIIKHFVYGVKQGIIIKSESGNWIDKNGIYSNKVEWEKTLKEFDHKCAYCGSDMMIVADHINPQSGENSTDEVYNLIPCCSKCNQEKSNMGMKEWIKYKNLSQEKVHKIRDHWSKYIPTTKLKVEENKGDK